MSDYLSDEEQIDALKRWWQTNGTFLIVGVVVAILAVVGWRFYQAQVAEQVAVSSDLYESYLEEEAGSDARAAIVEELATQFPGSTYHAFAVLFEANAAVEAGDLDAAAGLLADVAESAEEAEMRDLARVRLARVLHQLDRTDEALTALTDVKGEGFRAQVAELRGDLHVITGERDLAFQAYEAAMEGVENEAERPLLKMKLDNTRPPEIMAAVTEADSSVPDGQDSRDSSPTAEDVLEQTMQAVDAVSAGAEAAADEVAQAAADETSGEAGTAGTDSAEPDGAGGSDD